MEPIPLNLMHPEPSDLLNGEGWFASVAHNPLRLEWVWDTVVLGDGGRIGVDPGYQYWLPASAPFLPTMFPEPSSMYNAPPSVLRALDRLAEYAAANPNHDTDSIVREARSAIRLQSIEAEDFEKWVDSLWEQFDWVFGEWAKECRPAECKAEKWGCPGDMQRLDHVQFREAARTILSSFPHKKLLFTNCIIHGEPPEPYKDWNQWCIASEASSTIQGVRISSIKHRPLNDKEAHRTYAAIILALRDWLVPEEAELEDDYTSDGNDFMEELARYEERQRLRAQLTAEANRAQSYNPGAK